MNPTLALRTRQARLRDLLALVFLIAFLPDCSFGQAPRALPGRGPASLLFVRFAGPAGVHVTFYQGMAPSRDFVTPVTVGLRPGYLHRVRLSGLPGRPGLTLAPTLEVRGTLNLSAHLRPNDYPAPIVFGEQDVERVLAGSLLTKVVYLEDPDHAVAAATRPDQPLEMSVPPNDNIVEEARSLGRPMLIVRMGQRDVSNEELSRFAVPGTILLPGETALTMPPVPPQLPWTCFPPHDPMQGPRPQEEECLHDGGDGGRPVGLDRAGRLQGLDPADTAAEWTDSQNRRRVTVSNRVCLCVPRFAVLRTELPLAAHEVVLAPAGRQVVHEQVQLQTRQPSLETHQNEQLKAMAGRQRPTAALGNQSVGNLVRLEVLSAAQLDVGPAAALGTQAAQRLTEVERTRLAKQMELARNLSSRKGLAGVEQKEGTSVVGRVEGLSAVSSAAETRDLTICCNEVPHPPDKPLVLFKWASAQSAQVGDVVTFYLKYSNHGGQPITDVAVSDSLTGRLEYVPGTARADRDAVFTTQQNEAGSVILRWEIGGRLLPGTSGIVSFQARVR